MIPERLASALADRYRLERQLGQGGMATVYLAEDLKHKRQVAAKVLRPELAAVLGADRFVQEIKTTASLQHPHILPLFDSGEASGFLYYVMPYIEGETLRAKLDRESQLGIVEAVRITSEVADALDYAHRHNVIHRDIKPENILLHDGRPMVADFGIALAVSAAAGGRMTETGLSLGTPHYMSPEQASAEKELTNRSDIYSLGCVLYEMLAGDPPHTGASAQQIVMKILTEDVAPLTRLRKSVPLNVAAAITTALQKLPADRFETARAFADALENPGFTAAATLSAGQSAVPAAGPASWRRFLWPGVAALLAGAALWGWLRPAPRPPVARYGLAFPPGQELLDGVQPSFGVAPDGSWIVYDGHAASGNQLWIKPRDADQARPVPGTEHQETSAPQVSPDGEWIVFTAGTQLRKVPKAGGSSVTIADSVSRVTLGTAWLDDGTIVYRDAQDRLRRVPDTGGDAAVVWTPPDTGDLRPRLPTALPDGRGVVFGVCSTAACLNQALWALDLRSGEAKPIVSGGVRGWWVPTGHLVTVRSDGGVFAARFDLGALEVRGPSIPVLEGVQSPLGWFPDLDIAPSGTVLMLVGQAGELGPTGEVVWVSREGRATMIDDAWRLDLTGNVGWSLSPDGRYVAATTVMRSGAGSDLPDIWIKELDRGPYSRLTVDPKADFRPRWTPDGRLVSFLSTRGGNADLYVRRADGTAPAQLVLDLPEPIYEAVWSRDGAWLIVRTGAATKRDIWALRIGVDSVPTRLVSSAFDERAITLSPDARWLAYESDETGQNEIYVRPFPDVSGGKHVVSVGGGSRPLWSHSGREVFYVRESDAMLVAAQVRLSPTFVVTTRQDLFPVGGYALSANYTTYDVSADDSRFLMVRVVAGPSSGQRLILVENWLEELKAKVRR